jgi:NitT/TauT family transport system substrate-binding protein
MVNALVAGQMDVLPAVSLVPLIHLEIQFPRSVRLFSHSRMVPDRAFDSIIVAQNSDLGQLRDLETRTVGVFPGTSATNMLKAFFARQGVDSTKITFVPLAPAAHLSSLDSGAVDALFTYEPVTTAADASGRYRKLFGSVYADLQNPCPIGASAVSRRFEREHPELARRTISAIDEAVTMMREDPQTSKTLLSSRLGFSDGIAKQVNVVDVTLSSEVDVDSLQRFIDLPTDH